MRRLLVVVLLSGCIAGSVKGRVGIAADREGAGVQVGAGFAFGYAGKRSAVVESVGFVTGNTPKAGLDVGLDYVRMPEDSGEGAFGWRIGIGGVPLAYDGPATSGVRIAALLAVKDRTRHGGHEKWGSTTTRVLHAVGLEGLVGVSRREVPGEDMDRATVGGSLSVTYEVYMLSRGF